MATITEEAERQLGRPHAERVQGAVDFLERFRRVNGVSYAEFLRLTSPPMAYDWTHGMILAVGLHAQGCHYRKLATTRYDPRCEHGYKACPVCDECDCGAVDGPLDDRLQPVD